MSSWSAATRRRAVAAAVIPAASPPMTTSRSVTGPAVADSGPAGGSCDGRGRAGQGLLRFLDEPVDQLAGGDDVVDRADALPRGVALPVGVDAGGVVPEGEVHESTAGRHPDLVRERLELFGVLLVVLGGLVPPRTEGLAGERP